ncbi:hypothetical protein AGLY_009720 [Aphis glycines]|uniref:Uncharacterized protein n=1 Tax=Aphis glycines TaxID=307491 RepID=A0A6G0TH93_APHGL|nr:hypothetical protein AGLY_009720 [Aphis glycines]
MSLVDTLHPKRSSGYNHRIKHNKYTLNYFVMGNKLYRVCIIATIIHKRALGIIIFKKRKEKLLIECRDLLLLSIRRKNIDFNNLNNHPRLTSECEYKIEDESIIIVDVYEMMGQRLGALNDPADYKHFMIEIPNYKTKKSLTICKQLFTWAEHAGDSYVIMNISVKYINLHRHLVTKCQSQKACHTLMETIKSLINSGTTEANNKIKLLPPTGIGCYFFALSKL